ncbi:hypothetical protein E2C01_092102 [Portunus trituberculatus]|uniref:Uncharacterized protein n=1 Tax=Portunus trituberculatus TaxID=210409 RepID=A0A5B7JQV2_PORTR|nr:hypothetical protein [Portunus trituberculatus]
MAYETYLNTFCEHEPAVLATHAQQHVHVRAAACRCRAGPQCLGDAVRPNAPTPPVLPPSTLPTRTPVTVTSGDAVWQSFPQAQCPASLSVPCPHTSVSAAPHAVKVGDTCCAKVTARCEVTQKKGTVNITLSFEEFPLGSALKQHQGVAIRGIAKTRVTSVRYREAFRY